MKILAFPAPLKTKQITAVIKFLAIFEGIHPDDLSRYVKSPESTKDSYVLGRLEYHPAVHAFEQACYENNFVQSFDWGAWSEEAHRYMSDPALVGSADLATCIKLITTHFRAERFCDGHLAEVLKSGHISAILRRLKELEKVHTME